MPAPERRPATIYYKKVEASFGGIPGGTLEEAVRRAFGTATEDGGRIGDVWSQRCRTDPQNSQEHVFINHHQDDGNLYFGDLVGFTRGRSQVLLSNLGNVPEVDISQFSPPDQQEFMNAMMFWMLRGNHAFVIQSAALRTEALELYFSWLLSERTNLAPSDFHAMLIDEVRFDGDAPDGSEKIKKMTIGGRIPGNLTPAPGSEAPISRTRVERSDVGEIAESDGGWARRVLNAALGDQERVNAALRQIPSDANLKVSVSLGYERTRRDIDRTALRDMMRAARNVPDSDLEAVTDAGKIKGDKIRLTYSPRILTIGDLFDRNDVKRAMVEAYQNFVANGRIDP